MGGLWTGGWFWIGGWLWTGEGGAVRVIASIIHKHVHCDVQICNILVQ